jgi:hypothetical protein
MTFFLNTIVHPLRLKIAYDISFRTIRCTSSVMLGKEMAIKRLQVTLDLDPRISAGLNKIRSQAVCQHMELPRRYTRIPIFHHMLPDHLELYKKTLYNLTRYMPRFQLGSSTPQLDPTPPELTQHRHRIILPLDPPDILLNICSEIFRTWQGISRTAPEFSAKIVLFSGLSKEAAVGNLQHLLQMYPEGISLGDAEGLSIIERPRNLTKLERRFRKKGFLAAQARDILLKTFRFGLAAWVAKQDDKLNNSIGGEGDVVVGRQQAMIEHELGSNVMEDRVEVASPAIFPGVRTVPLGESAITDTTPWVERGIEPKEPVSHFRGRKVPRDAVRRISLGENFEPTREESLRQYREQHMIKETVRRVPLGEDDSVGATSYGELYGELLVRKIDGDAFIEFTPDGEPKVRGVVDQTSGGLIQYGQPERPHTFRAHIVSDDLKRILLGEDVSVNTTSYGELVVRREDKREKPSMCVAQDESLVSKEGPNFFRAQLAGEDIHKTLLGEESVYISAAKKSAEEEAKAIFRVPVDVRRPQYVV